MCALAKGDAILGASSQRGTGSPHYAGRCHGRGVDHGSPAELSRRTRFARTARPVSDQCPFVVHVYTLSRDTTSTWETVPKSRMPTRGGSAVGNHGVSQPLHEGTSSWEGRMVWYSLRSAVSRSTAVVG